ncbi:MAG: efflux RND transporter periplasmic adaptor subunit, partial [Inhella sp.]
MPQRLNSLAPVLALLMAMAGLSACQRPGTDPKGGADSAPKAPLLIAPEDVRSVSASGLAGGPVITGAIQPARRADLRAEVAAVVLEVGKDNGERVRRGDLIVRLDATSIRDSLASAEEALRAAKQGFEQSERVLARQRTLNQQGMTSMQALEDAEIRRNGAQSELIAARARVAAAQQQVARTEVRAPFDGVVSDRRASAGDTAQVGKELLKVIDPR